jgi:DNA-binding CsgD family transcriptional regulator
MPWGRPPVLLGRAGERRAFDRLLTDIRDGRSTALVMRGEAGVGKTTLLHYCARQASGVRLLRIAGVEAEMELPFAALHQLCAPILPRLDKLPDPQQNALSVALGLAPGQPADRFLVGLAALGLLSATAEERPLLCLVEDAQWLDVASSQILGFVGRRLLAESVGIVFAVRTPHPTRSFDGLPELPLTGLDDEAARSLLARAVQGRMDIRVRDRIVAETRGNPLALLELPQQMNAAELAGGFEPPIPADLPRRIQEQYARRVEALPRATRRLILLAAADPVGDATLIWRAAHKLKIRNDALGPAQDAGLLEIGAQVRFHHPLVRSAVYRTASLPERRRAHEALASVSDPELDADRRAWHRALAAAGPDEKVAEALELSAGRAQTRGGFPSAAAFLERSAALTADPAEQARRSLAAAQAHHSAGAPQPALALLAGALAGPLAPLQHAEAAVLRAEIAFTTNRGSDAAPLLLNAARQLESLDVTLSRETYLDALTAAQFAGQLAPGVVRQVAEAARAAPPSPSPRAPDLLLDGLAVMITEGHAAAAPLLQRALREFHDGDIVKNGGFRWLWLAEEAAQEMWDHDTWLEFAVRQLQVVRDAGALGVLPLAFSAVIVAQIYAGELGAAAALIDEVKIAIEATGSQLAPYGALILAAWRGRASNLVPLVDATLDEVVPRGEGIGVTTCHWVTALLRNGLGQYEEALAAARLVIEPERVLDWPLNVTLPEFIEAAVRSGHPQQAGAALVRLTGITRASQADWGLGIEARCRALLSEPTAAEPFYREAIERLGRTRVRGEHARAHLLYGEWLRREGRRVDARTQLRIAYDEFLGMGIEAFAERARRELLATGETVRKRRVESANELTPQEWQIASLAREGLSNPDIGERLFLSPRTVEWHLKKVFSKLGIKSRMGLHDALPARGGRNAKRA